MERKGIGVILMAGCLVFAFSVIPAEAAPKPKPEDTAQRCSDGKDNDEDGLIDGADPDCEGLTGGGGGGGSAGGGKRERITVWFQDGGGYQLQSDGQGTVSHPNCGAVLAPCYIDGEQKVKAYIDPPGGIGDPGGIRLELLRSPRGITLDLTNDCESFVAGSSCDDILPNELKGLVQPWA